MTGFDNEEEISKPPPPRKNIFERSRTGKKIKKGLPQGKKIGQASPREKKFRKAFHRKINSEAIARKN